MIRTGLRWVLSSIVVGCILMSCMAGVAGAAAGQDLSFSTTTPTPSFVTCGAGCQCLFEYEIPTVFGESGRNYVKCSETPCGQGRVVEVMQNKYCFRAQQPKPALQPGIPGPVASTGSLSISSQPSGASVTLDGQYRGTTPVTIPDLAPGSHSLRLSLSGYKDNTQSPSVSAGQITALSVPLVPVSGSSGVQVGVEKLQDVEVIQLPDEQQGVSQGAAPEQVPAQKKTGQGPLLMVSLSPPKPGPQDKVTVHTQYSLPVDKPRIEIYMNDKLEEECNALTCDTTGGPYGKDFAVSVRFRDKSGNMTKRTRTPAEDLSKGLAVCPCAEPSTMLAQAVMKRQCIGIQQDECGIYGQTGDGCDPYCDNCPKFYNPNQTDTDGDGVGDACDNCNGYNNTEIAGQLQQLQMKGKVQNSITFDMLDCGDEDGDGIINSFDNCKSVPNKDQIDSDGDGIGDACPKTPSSAQVIVKNQDCGYGTFNIVSAEPVQVLYGATKLVVGKGTAFRVNITSTYACDKYLKIGVELNPSEWGVSGYNSYDYKIQPQIPSFTSQNILIPAYAQNYPVMLPFVAQGHEKDQANDFSSTKNMGKLLYGNSHPYDNPPYFGCKPNIRVMPAPKIKGEVFYKIELDPSSEISYSHDGKYSWQSSRPTVKPRSWKFLGIYTNGGGVVRDSTNSEKGMLEYMNHLLAVFPIADDDLTWNYAPKTLQGTCSNNPNAKCWYTYDCNSHWNCNKDINPAFYADWANIAKSWKYDVGIGLGKWFGQNGGSSFSIDPVASLGIDQGVAGPRPWALSHEFNHFTTGIGDDNYWYDCDIITEPGFWINNYQDTTFQDNINPITGQKDLRRLYFQTWDGDTDSHWITMFSLSNRCAPKKAGPINDGYGNLINPPIGNSVFLGSDPEVLLVRGIIYKNNTANFDYFSIIQDSNLDLPPGITGNYTFVLYDAKGNVLGKSGYNPTFYITKPIFNNTGLTGGTIDEWNFVERIEWKSGTKRIELQDKTGKVLATKTVSENAPSVRIISPNGGETWNQGEPVTIRWQGNDQDGDSLIYTVGISEDGGTIWVPLKMNMKENETSITLNDMGGGDTNRIKVIASDGVNTGEAVSAGNFRVNRPGEIPGLLILVAGALVAICAVAGGWYFLKKRKPSQK